LTIQKSSLLSALIFFLLIRPIVFLIRLCHTLARRTSRRCDVPLASSDTYVTLVDLKLAMESLRLTKSPGPDDISSVWFSHSYELIKFHLVALYSACFSLSHFPNKSASIIIMKKNNKANYSHPSCFRPISILNAFSKLFEKIILAKLKRLATSHNWFSPNQHGA
jgi:hypothetical protein